MNRPLRILLVENEPVDALSISRATAEIGADAHFETVTTYREAVEILDGFDAVIVDLGLDDVRIEEDLSLLDVFDKVPSVVFTGANSPEVAKYIGRKFHGLISKTAGPTEFLTSVAHEIGRFEAEIEERERYLRKIGEYQSRLRNLPGLGESA